MSLPNKAVDRLFQRLVATYGAAWTRQWADVPMADVKTVWADELSVFADWLEAMDDPLAAAPLAPAPANPPATEPHQPGDILNPKGEPFKNRMAAHRAQKAHGGELIPVAGGWVVRPSAAADAPQEDAGWKPFPSETGTLNIPRADMPQVKNVHRGPLVNFLSARGVTSEQVEIDPAELKPTQDGFSQTKVDEAADADTDRAILISSDNHIIDGHHQAVAKLKNGQPVRALRLNAPADELLPLVLEFPSSTTERQSSEEAAAAPTTDAAAADPTGGIPVPGSPAGEDLGPLTDVQDAPQETAGAQATPVVAPASSISGADAYNALVPQWNDLVARYKAGDAQDGAIVKSAMDLLASEMEKARGEMLLDAKRKAEKAGDLAQAKRKTEYEVMPVGARLRPSEFDESKGIDWQKTGADEWTARGEWFQKGKTRTTAEMAASGGLVAMAAASEPARTKAGSGMQTADAPAKETAIDRRNRMKAEMDGLGAQSQPKAEKQPEAAPAKAPASQPKRETAVARRDRLIAERANYFTPGSIVKSYGGGFDEVLEYTATEGGGFSVRVHEVRKVGDEWHRVGKPQDARTHSTQPEARDLAAGPVARLPYQAAGDVVYTERRSDRQPFPNAVARGTAPAAPTPAADRNPIKKPEPSSNTIFTEDAAAAARARLKAKLGRLNSGIDPEMLMDGITLAGYHIEKGARTFAAYAKAMVEDLGDGVKPYLKSWYMGVRYDPRAGAFDGMDSAAVVEAADVDAVTKEEKPAKTLTESLYQAIRDNAMPKDNPALKKLVEAFDGKPSDQERMKQAQESLETAIVMAARDVVAKNDGDRAKFDELLRLYESQPNLNIRTSTSIANQAYSTPAPLAFLSSRLAGINKDTVAHEPTGGTGMLLIAADPAKAIVNELNDLRVEALKAQGFKPTQKDAATQLLVPEGTQPEAVVTNPPFGSIKDAEGKPVKVKVDGFSLGQIDHLIAARALETMKDDGRAVLIIGANKVAGGLSTDDRIFFNWLYSHYNVAGHFEVEGDLYTRQGAGWPVRVITINGRQKSDKFSPVAGAIQRVDNWDAVYEQFTQSLTSAQAPRIGAGAANDSTRGVSVLAAPAYQAPGGGRPESGTRGNGNVAGTRAGGLSNSSEPAGDVLGGRFDEQRLNADSFVPQPQRGQNPDGAARSGKSADTAAVEEAQGNEFQTPYITRSSRKDEGVLIPANMAQPTQDALSRLEDEVGDIDEFARKELGYATVADLHNALMGLQVDSVATSIYQIKQGKAVVIADQTGIGKGRQAASIIRWAARQGMTPVFMTKTPSLFTDMYGDLADIGTNDVQPFIMNSNEWVAGEGGAKLFANKPGRHKNVIQEIANSGQLPEGRNALFLTYSQINVVNAQRQALMALAPNAVFVLDESHTAAGESSTGEFVIGALGAAKGVVYLSATYAKRPDNMPLYFKTDIGDAAADTEGLAEAMASGGLPLQTVVSNNLVKAGQMFRRERSYDGVSIASVFDSKNRALHERLSNEATKALRAIVSADRMFHRVYVRQLAERLAKAGATVQDGAGNQIEQSVQHTEFSSVVHNFVKQMLLGLKAQSAADEAVASLKRGEKPIIAVENTMGSFLNEYAAANGIGQGESLGTFDYRTVLTRALARSRVVIEVAPNGDKVKRPVRMDQLDAQTQAAYKDAQAVIDGLTLNIPVSPIDWMRAEITRAGYKVAEITGRTLSVDYGNPKNPVLSAVDVTEQKDKVNTTRQFNSGNLDALILNVAGSTGISLHASEKFEDQRQRHMIVAQAAGDINTFMQMLGRIHRTGQVRLPKYTLQSVDLPTEKRPTAVLSIKMKSLNANTSSNTESATSVKSSDILNKYGDQIVNQYLRDNYALARALDLADSIGDDPVEDIARKATGRLALQPIEVQHAFYDEVEAQYDALIDYLNKTNQNDLEPRTFDFDAKETRQEVLFEGPNKSTPFGEDAIYGEYSIKAQGTPMKPEEIAAAIAESVKGKTGAEHADALVKSLLQTYADQMNADRAKNGLVPGKFDEAKYASFMKGIYGEEGAAYWVNVAKQHIAAGKDVQLFTPDEMASVQGSAAGIQFIRDHAVGKTFRVDINSEPFNAVVTGIRSTHKSTGNPFSLSKIQVTVAVNGALRSLSVPATQFGKIEVSGISPMFKIEQLFKEQPPNQRETAKIITGNLLAAYGEIRGVRGTIITFTKQDGTSEQGILLPKLFDYSKNTRGDYLLATAKVALKFLQTSNNKDIGRFGIMSRDGVVRVLPAGQGIRIQVPKSKAKGGKYFLDKPLLAASGDFTSSGSQMVATVYDPKDATTALEVLMKKQALYALPSMADEARAISGAHVPPGGTDEAKVSFSRSAGYGGGMSKESATAIVNAIKARWANAPEVVVVQDMQDPAVPKRVRDADLDQRSMGAAGEPEGFWYGGKSYIVAGALSTPGDVVRVLFHEVLGHHGLRGVFGSTLDPILRQIAGLRRNEIVVKAFEYGLVPKNLSPRATMQEVYAAMSDAQRLQAAEEVLAVMAQTKPEMGFVKRAIAAVRAWLRKNVPGFQDMKLTDADLISQFILPARRFVEQGPSAARAGRSGSGALPALSFSMAPQGVLDEIAKLDGLFGVAKSSQKTMEGVIGELAPLWQVKKITNIPGRTQYNITTADGNTARVIVRPFNPYGESIYGYDLDASGEMTGEVVGRPGDNPEDAPDADDVWIDVSLLREGGRDGELIYQAVANFAHNTGKVFIGDPAGLSDQALRRRTEQMLSSALKHGTTRHIAPHPRQVSGDAKLGVPALKWVYGDDIGNIERMIDVSLRSLENAFPSSKLIGYDSATSQFYRTDTGQRFANRGQLARVVGQSIESRLRLAGRKGSQGEAGWRTVARGALFNDLKAAMAVEPTSQYRGSVLGGLREVGARLERDGASGEAYPAQERIFYSRRRDGLTPESGAALFSRSADAPNDPRALDAIKQFDVRGKTSNTLKHYRGMSLQTLGRRQLVDLYAQELPQLERYNDLVQLMDAEKNDTGAEADRLATEWGNLDKETKKPGEERRLAELMHESTLAQIDPEKEYQPGDSRAQWAGLRNKFNTLDAMSQALFVKARNMYADHYEQVRKAIQERIERSDMSGGQKKAIMVRMDEDFFKKTKGVYFPLARFGNYVVLVKDANGEIASVNRAETLNEAETTRKQLMEVFPKDKGFSVSKVLKDAEFNPGRDAVGKGFMADLFSVLEKQGVDEALRDSVSQLYLSSLPDLSWAKHGIHRKGTPGFSQDARRAFAQNMFHGARYLAKLRYADKLQAELDAMQDHIKAYSEIEEYDSVKAQQVVDEMVKRHGNLMNPKANALSTALTSVGFVFYLGVSPAAAMVNLSQTALVAYPIMGAKWGFSKAGAALLRASKETVAAKNDISKILKGDELAAYEQAVKDGTIDVTMAHDLAGISQGEDAKVTWALRPVMRAASFLFHHAERFNRQATFIAAFRLSKETGADNKTAFEEAKKATYDGHFDYGASNRPRIMQGNVAKVVTLFKQYGQNMVYTLSRQAYLSMKGLTPEDRAEARKQLGGILALHAAAAGAMGLPLVGPLLAAASFLGGDDDEPWDAEVALKNAMADAFGPKAAEVMAHGLSRLTPWDISGRVALDRLILPDVREGLEGQKWAESMMAAAIGPVGGIFTGVAKGLQSIGDGKYGRGLEEMLPVALRNPVKAIRFYEEGEKDKSGVVIKDEVSLAGVLGQASGFAPSEVRLATERGSAIYGHDKARMERRKTLMAQFAQARMAGDDEGVREAREAIARFNAKNPTRRILPQNLAQSIRNRRRRIQDADQGVYLPKNRRDSYDAVRF